MFYLAKDAELTQELLQKMINEFRMQMEPRLQKYKDYYDGNQAILRKTYTDATKPCSRAVTNFCSDIVDSYCGYLAAPGFISYGSKEQDIEAIMDVLDYNDHDAQDADLLESALIYGTGAELVYMDEEAQVRFRTIDPRQCFAVYDDSLTGDLQHFVRVYPVGQWDDSDNYAVDVYGPKTLRKFTMNGKNGHLELQSEEPHNFAQCPANVFHLPDERSVFHGIMGLQDAYNELQNCEIDDYSAFVDAFLVLEGMDADNGDIQGMKENRVLVVPEGAKAAWLTKNANDAQVENMLSRIQSAIYRVGKCPDFSSESFVGGVSSGIAIRYRLTGMETKAAKICAAMKKALLRRIEIICAAVSMVEGEDVFRDVDIEFKRNIPDDMTSTVNLVNALKGTVSDATLLSQLPFVTDVQAELDALNEQKQSNMELYGLTASGGFTEDEDEGDEE